MGINPNDRWKVAALVLVIVLVFGYGVKATLDRMAQIRSSQGAPAAGTGSTPQNMMIASSGGMASSGMAAARLPNPADLEDETGMHGPPGRDPFTPAKGQPDPNARDQAAPPPRTRTESYPTQLIPRGQLFGGGFGPSTPAPVAKPEAPAITLKGVLVGSTPMAVVEVNGQIFYKQQGERLPGGLTVGQITEAGIVLKGSGEDQRLQVGHTTRPAPPQGSAGGPPATSLLPRPRVERVAAGTPANSAAQADRAATQSASIPAAEPAIPVRSPSPVTNSSTGGPLVMARATSNDQPAIQQAPPAKRTKRTVRRARAHRAYVAPSFSGRRI